MLQELTIRDFAIIEKMDLEFQSQMTVLTGETGAGKSIIIDALGLLSGGRGSVDFIRKGANKAVIQGLFDVPGDSKTFSMSSELTLKATALFCSATFIEAVKIFVESTGRWST